MLQLISENRIMEKNDIKVIATECGHLQRFSFCHNHNNNKQIAHKNVCQ